MIQHIVLLLVNTKKVFTDRSEVNHWCMGIFANPKMKTPTSCYVYYIKQIKRLNNDA